MVNVDEFEHTEVEQQARRDQQRVLIALARRNQQPVPMADVEHRRDPEVQREKAMTCVTQAAFQSPTAQDDAAAGEPPTHPAPLGDGGGSDVGGVESHQTQEIVTETGHQASITLVGATAPSAEERAVLRHQRDPLTIAGDQWARGRALLASSLATACSSVDLSPSAT
jgi:hypothetical protein